MKLSPAVFTTVYCAAYAAAFRLNRPLFRYYPIPHQWVSGATGADVRPGPPIVWYGLVASAALVATAAMCIAAGATALVKDKWRVSGLRGWLGLTPWVAAAYCAFLLRLFFL